MKLRTTALLAAVAAVTLAACDDAADTVDDALPDDVVEAPDDTDDPDADDDLLDGETDDGVAGGTAVTVADNSFDPADLEVSEGDTVEWTHEGDIPHNVTFDDEASDTLNTGDTYERTFEEAGEFDYTCTFHTGMDGTISVS